MVDFVDVDEGLVAYDAEGLARLVEKYRRQTQGRPVEELGGSRRLYPRTRRFIATCIENQVVSGEVVIPRSSQVEDARRMFDAAGYRTMFVASGRDGGALVFERR